MREDKLDRLARLVAIVHRDAKDDVRFTYDASRYAVRERWTVSVQLGEDAAERARDVSPDAAVDKLISSLEKRIKSHLDELKSALEGAS